MILTIDIECNALVNPSQIWVVVAKEFLTGVRHVYRQPTTRPEEADSLQRLVERSTTIIGHNIIGYDWPVLSRLLGYTLRSDHEILDTLILSRLIDYPRKHHSVEDYGIEFGIEKSSWRDYSKYSQELEDYCVRDVDITERIYKKYSKYINDPAHYSSIRREHDFQKVCNSLEENGFYFNKSAAEKLLNKVTTELSVMDKEIHEAFPPRLKLIREITPKETKFGTISLSSIPKQLRNCISDFNVGCPFSYCRWTEFNPGSPKQVVSLLNDAGWKPTDKTDGHVDAERELSKLKRQKKKSIEVDLRIQALYTALERLEKYGWKINEANLETVPHTAPKAARLLAKRILLESRRKSLTEWLDLVGEDGRIHGKFFGVGAWTHRMAHRNPNTANIPNAVHVHDGSPVLLGKELRSLWCAPKGRLLVGVDAEAIQFRGFAHLVNDPELTNAIVNGNKKDKTDPHSLHMKVFGPVAKTRNASKHSMFAIFFGGRASMISQIMGCTKEEANEAIQRLLQRYPKLRQLEEEVFPEDARRGWFIGIDGRKVRILGDDTATRKHHCMSGYLQNFEKVVMAEATLIFEPRLKDYDSFLVDLVHDEWQTETPNDLRIAEEVAQLECSALVQAGKNFKLNCPLAGSYKTDDGRFTFGRTWYDTH